MVYFTKYYAKHGRWRHCFTVSYHLVFCFAYLFIIILFCLQPKIETSNNRPVNKYMSALKDEMRKMADASG